MTKVLVVDDSISVRKALERVLIPRAMIVFSAASGEKALEQLAMEKPDLMIVDVVMPGMSGFELCNHVKNVENLKQIPIIMISGIVDANVIAQAEKVGAFGVVGKPFTPDDLFPKIDAALLNTISSNTSTLAIKNDEIENTIPNIESKPVQSVPIVQNPITLLLEPFLEKTEVETVALIQRDGTVIVAVGKKISDPALFATFCRTLTSISGVLGEYLEAGSLHTASFEYEQKNLVLTSVNKSISLAVVLKSEINTIKQLVQKQLIQIRLALE